MQDWPILEKLWQRHCDPSYHASAHDDALWRRQVQALYAHNIAHPVALQFLLQQRPGLAAFRDWIVQSEAQYRLLDQGLDDAAGDMESDLTLSPQEIAFWQENGYLVLPGVIDAAACVESCAAVWHHLAASPDDTASWYRTAGQQQGLMLPLYNQPRLNTNRASKRIRAAYQQLYGPRAIYKTIDHLSFNPPETEQFTFRGDGLHWDVSLTLPIPERFQGLLYLTDCAAADGAFHCVPGFQHQIGAWLGQLPPDADARAIAAQTLVPQAVPGKAGDFVIWHQALPHCATPNRGRTPRIVQYLSYVPVDETVQAVWR
jgi:ectoine hydroxylase-related dioxygenase (phytanoyl-CoA dioxygenase family)